MCLTVGLHAHTQADVLRWNVDEEHGDSFQFQKTNVRSREQYDPVCSYIKTSSRKTEILTRSGREGGCDIELGSAFGFPCKEKSVNGANAVDIHTSPHTHTHTHTHTSSQDIKSGGKIGWAPLCEMIGQENFWSARIVCEWIQHFYLYKTFPHYLTENTLHHCVDIPGNTSITVVLQQ